VLVAALGVVALAVGAPEASAKAPCWRQILDEWVDNNNPPRIRRTYPLRCYGEAIAHVPEDLRVYSDIELDILAARQLAARRNFRTTQSVRPRTQSTTKRDPKRGLFKQAFDRLGPRNSDSVPLPLLILAGLSLALIAAGGGGLLSRRLRSRRVPAP
jgi:hypothetical protein